MPGYAQGVTSRDEEELWRSIVENYGERPLLEPEDAASSPGTDRDPDPEVDHDPYAEPEPAPRAAAAGQWAQDPGRQDGPHDERHDPADAEDRFVPPPPPPLPRPSAPRALAWAGMLGTPALMVALAMVQVTIRPVWGAVMAAVFVTAFGYLVVTMDRSPRQPWDDGSEV